MSTYRVYWSFHHINQGAPEGLPYVDVSATSENDAKSAASQRLNNPLAWIVKVVKRN